jgi:hypothetical protein
VSARVCLQQIRRIPRTNLLARVIARPNRDEVVIDVTGYAHGQPHQETRLRSTVAAWPIVERHAICCVHDTDDVVPGRICGRPRPCRDHEVVS